MTIIVLDRHPGPLPPYADWLSHTGEDVVLITGRSTAEVGLDGYAEIHFLPDYATSGSPEQAVIDIAGRATVSALVATATGDLVRAGALRDHLGIPGQSRADAAVFADLVATRRRLLDAGVPTLPAGEVLRVVDLFWHRAQWGDAPLRVRDRKQPGRPTIAVLDDADAVRAYTENGLSPTMITVPSLLVEPRVEGQRLVVIGTTVDTPVGPAPVRALVRAALAALPTLPGQPYRVEILHTQAGEWLVDSVDAATATAADHRVAVHVQAGAAPISQEATRWAS